MSERIPEEKLNKILTSTDIVDVVSDYVQLKKQGRNYFGLCPFHGENTPSFSVSPDKQIFHCFGCGAGGNAFTFLMDVDGLTFLEAAQKLGAKIGEEISIQTSSTGNSLPPQEDEKQMLEAHELLSKFYHHLLLNTKEGQEALEYLLSRGFTTESITKFQIGWSLPSWDFTVKFLQKRGYSLEIMEQAGLLVRRERDDSFLDRFRGRIMFPITNTKGNTVAFSGRSIGSNEEPKYLNSPETKIFNKSSILYHYHEARGSIRRKQQAVLFEGFADVISASEAEVENGVATMGTSLTEQQIGLLKRLTDSVVICYDGDAAGIQAAFRAGNLLVNHQMNIRIATIPEQLDPDDYISKYGAERFQNDVIGASLTFMAFKLRYYKLNKNLNDEGDRLNYIEDILKEITQLSKAVEKDYYLRYLAEDFDLSLDALQQQLFDLEGSTQKKANSSKPVQTQRPVSKKVETKLLPAYQTAERRLIAYMLKDSNVAYKIQEWLAGKNLNIDEHQAIITYLFGYYEEGLPPNASAFIGYLPDERLRRIVTEIEMMSLSEESTEQELLDYVKQVLKHQKMLKIKEKETERKEAERHKDYRKEAQIAMEIVQLRKSL
ncbi:DNA primase [Rossellomorea aquimaris]|uniref:DNA primase n=1 Tax=Rossellomorea aquimaris TaxID=189382 RepID=G4XHN6_9BACI|nr:DNA primase [Rossellomorea aquimaris]AEP19936.1 DNA primase [Rossellomorea aquimaris TF-12]